MPPKKATQIPVKGKGDGKPVPSEDAEAKKEDRPSSSRIPVPPPSRFTAPTASSSAKIQGGSPITSPRPPFAQKQISRPSTPVTTPGIRITPRLNTFLTDKAPSPAVSAGSTPTTATRVSAHEKPHDMVSPGLQFPKKEPFYKTPVKKSPAGKTPIKGALTGKASPEKEILAEENIEEKKEEPVGTEEAQLELLKPISYTPPSSISRRAPNDANSSSDPSSNEAPVTPQVTKIKPTFHPVLTPPSTIKKPVIAPSDSTAPSAEQTVVLSNIDSSLDVPAVSVIAKPSEEPLYSVPSSKKDPLDPQAENLSSYADLTPPSTNKKPAVGPIESTIPLPEKASDFIKIDDSLSATFTGAAAKLDELPPHLETVVFTIPSIPDEPAVALSSPRATRSEEVKDFSTRAKAETSSQGENNEEITQLPVQAEEPDSGGTEQYAELPQNAPVAASSPPLSTDNDRTTIPAPFLGPDLIEASEITVPDDSTAISNSTEAVSALPIAMPANELMAMPELATSGQEPSESASTEPPSIPIARRSLSQPIEKTSAAETAVVSSTVEEGVARSNVAISSVHASPTKDSMEGAGEVEKNDDFEALSIHSQEEEFYELSPEPHPLEDAPLAHTGDTSNSALPLQSEDLGSPSLQLPVLEGALLGHTGGSSSDAAYSPAEEIRSQSSGPSWFERGLLEEHDDYYDDVAGSPDGRSPEDAGNLNKYATSNKRGNARDLAAELSAAEQHSPGSERIESDEDHFGGFSGTFESGSDSRKDLPHDAQFEDLKTESRPVRHDISEGDLLRQNTAHPHGRLSSPYSEDITAEPVEHLNSSTPAVIHHASSPGTSHGLQGPPTYLSHRGLLSSPYNTENAGPFIFRGTPPTAAQNSSRQQTASRHSQVPAVSKARHRFSFSDADEDEFQTVGGFAPQTSRIMFRAPPPLVNAPTFQERHAPPPLPPRNIPLGRSTTSESEKEDIEEHYIPAPMFEPAQPWPENYPRQDGRNAPTLALTGQKVHPLGKEIMQEWKEEKAQQYANLAEYDRQKKEGKRGSEEPGKTRQQPAKKTSQALLDFESLVRRNPYHEWAPAAAAALQVYRKQVEDLVVEQLKDAEGLHGTTKVIAILQRELTEQSRDNKILALRLKTEVEDNEALDSDITVLEERVKTLLSTRDENLSLRQELNRLRSQPREGPTEQDMDELKARHLNEVAELYDELKKLRNKDMISRADCDQEREALRQAFEAEAVVREAEYQHTLNNLGSEIDEKDAKLREAEQIEDKNTTLRQENEWMASNITEHEQEVKRLEGQLRAAQSMPAQNEAQAQQEKSYPDIIKNYMLRIATLEENNMKLSSRPDISEQDTTSRDSELKQTKKKLKKADQQQQYLRDLLTKEKQVAKRLRNELMRKQQDWKALDQARQDYESYYDENLDAIKQLKKEVTVLKVELKKTRARSDAGSVVGTEPGPRRATGNSSEGKESEIWEDESVATPASLAAEFAILRARNALGKMRRERALHGAKPPYDIYEGINAVREAITIAEKISGAKEILARAELEAGIVFYYARDNDAASEHIGIAERMRKHLSERDAALVRRWRKFLRQDNEVEMGRDGYRKRKRVTGESGDIGALLTSTSSAEFQEIPSFKASYAPEDLTTLHSQHDRLEKKRRERSKVRPQRPSHGRETLGQGTKRQRALGASDKGNSEQTPTRAGSRKRSSLLKNTSAIYTAATNDSHDIQGDENAIGTVRGSGRGGAEATLTEGNNEDFGSQRGSRHHDDVVETGLLYLEDNSRYGEDIYDVDAEGWGPVYDSSAEEEISEPDEEYDDDDYEGYDDDEFISDEDGYSQVTGRRLDIIYEEDEESDDP